MSKSRKFDQNHENMNMNCSQVKIKMSPIQNKIKKSFDIPEYKTGEGEMMMLSKSRVI